MSGTRKSSPPTSSPHRPRAARAADRCVAGSKSPGPGPVLPAAPLDELCPSTRAILARLSAIPDAPFGGGPIRSRPDSPASNDSPTAPRHAASSHYSWPTVTPRSDPRAELRMRCARDITPRRRAQVAPPSRSKLALFCCSVPLYFLCSDVASPNSRRCAVAPQNSPRLCGG